jgi:pimeloyl-ACP methyl ester carboxylesterase
MDLAYADEGPGPVVMLLHGFPLSRAMWVDQLSGIGSIYRVIAPDLRGHGESPVPEGVYTMDAMADDVVELLETLEISGPVVVGGLSMGGYVALSLAARYPTRVRALMLMDTKAAPDTPEAAQAREAMAQAVIAADSAAPVVDAMLPRLFAKMTREQHPERVEPMKDVMRQTSPRGIAGALRGMAARPDRRADLPKIVVPALVLVGDEDVITPVAESKSMAEALPNARLEVISHAGHLAPYENPSDANAAILRFLKTLEN